MGINFFLNIFVVEKFKNMKILKKHHKTWLVENNKDYKNIASLSRALTKEFSDDLKDFLPDSVRRTCSKFLEKKKLTNNANRLEDTEEFLKASERALKESKYYIVTWQQNETPIHINLWNNILKYAEFLDAEISVILGRYKNPTSIFKKTDDKWDRSTEDYWDTKKHDIHKHLTILSDVKITPTRKYPLSSMEGLTRDTSFVVGHPKMHLKTCAVLKGHPEKIMLTTGAISLPNYTDSNQGYVSNHNHKFGFVIIEIKDDEVFYIRQVEADSDGNFIDLIHDVKNQVVSRNIDFKGLICGDSHHWSINKEIDKKNDEICEKLNIDKVVLHDVIDGESCNNHIIKNPIEQYKRMVKGQNLIEKELEDLAGWLGKKLDYNIVIPHANHNDRLDRILQEDWRKDIVNSMFYLKYTQAVLEEKANKGVLAYFLEERFGDKITTLKHNDSYIIGKYECSQHGHLGSNGARGSMVGFRNLNIPIITAHTHSTYRADDFICVGANCDLDAPYLKGASSWNSSSCLISKNGIGQIIIYIRGEFTTFKI